MKNYQVLQRLATIESNLPPASNTCPECGGKPVLIADCDECYGAGTIDYTYSGDADQDIAWLASELRSRIPVGIPQTLETLFQAYGQELLEKALRARVKYGFPEDGWKQEGWQDTLVKELLEHVYKGDPRDVAVYSAFAWWHGWSIRPTCPSIVPEQLHVKQQVPKATLPHLRKLVASWDEDAVSDSKYPTAIESEVDQGDGLTLVTIRVRNAHDAFNLGKAFEAIDDRDPL
ncbi:hypothetical protein [Hymenobacter crusticola]|uniref:Uncharacterized protein n=1 Tax=Hymenobacter crusticola TaxID=1770526 RepID=A0A2C9ZTY1_9BACT|nr:hypothetical protein [Hymenobacter crusticola]OUJ70174.1 hypothetical protein BXP70_25325 [Hymenobacter crusticola]